MNFTQLPIEILSTIVDLDSKSLNALLRTDPIFQQTLYNITNLDLPNNTELTDYQLSLMPNLRVLRLPKNNKITGNGLAYLPNLEVLELAGKKIKDADLQFVPKLTTLILNNNQKVTDAGLRYVPNLVNLGLDFTVSGVTDKGIQLLPKLKTLSLYNIYGLTEKAFKNSKQLETATITGNQALNANQIKRYAPKLKYLNVNFEDYNF